MIFTNSGLKDSLEHMTPENVDMKFHSILNAYKIMLRLFYTNGVAIIATWQIVAFSLSKRWLFDSV